MALQHNVHLTYLLICCCCGLAAGQILILKEASLYVERFDQIH